MQRIAIILGTRPEIIKMSPVTRECEKQNLDYFILHTGQHYSYNLDNVFFEQLELPEAKYNLDVGSNILAGTKAEMILNKTEEMINRENNWGNPFGDGKAGRRIVKILEEGKC
jgi:UDP-N-acetylglucosamine 2-epimerase (non-hydrolysing)